MVAGMTYVAEPHLRHALRAPSVRHALAGLLAVVVGVVMWRVRRWLKRLARIRRVDVSADRADYVIENDDYRRGLPKEHAYRRAMQLTLLATFDNRCAKCGARDDGVDLDHFFLPKNEGGCFIMRHKHGHLVNNAVPLCVGCNRSKSDRSYVKFFSRDQLAIVLEKNAVMTKQLNQRALLDRSGQPHPRTKVDRAA